MECDNCGQTFDLVTQAFPGLQLCLPCQEGHQMDLAARQLYDACLAAAEHLFNEGGTERGRNKKVYEQCRAALWAAKLPAVHPASHTKGKHHETQNSKHT